MTRTDPDLEANTQILKDYEIIPSVRFPLGDDIVRRSAGRNAEPALRPVRDAATVALVRAAAAGLDAYLMRRRRSMRFAAGQYVFPGGGVDDLDFDSDVEWAGPTAEAWARRLGVDATHAAALICAAVRETFEECGIMLAGHSARDIISDTTGKEWERDRTALERHEVSLAEVLNRRRLVLRSDLLASCSTAWQTPAFEPSHYQTWFFAACVPEGQRTLASATEADRLEWHDLSSVLDAVEAGEMAMLAPTYFTCLELAQFRSPAEVLSHLHAAQGEPVEMFQPTPERLGSEHYLTTPRKAAQLLRQRRTRA